MSRQQRAPWRHRILVSIASALLAGSAAFSSANASVPVSPGTAMVNIATAAHLGPNDTVVGTLAATTRLHVVVSLKLRNKAGLDSFIAQATNLTTKMTQRRMSRTQFAENFSPTQSEADAVAQYLSSNGFSDVTIAPNRLLVSAYADAGVVQSAFRTTLAQVHTASGETAYANTSSIQIPASLQGTVQAVLGLQNVRHPRTLERYAKTNTVQGHNPIEFAHIYSGDSLPTASTVTVGIITAGDMTQTLADLTTFTTQNSLPAVNTQVVTVGSGSSSTAGTGEWNLDSQSIIGTSGGVQKLMFYAADSMSFADLTAAMNAAVNDTTNNPQVVNMSFGACEYNGSAAAAEDQVFQNAIALGITFVASSGDDGANCDSSTFGVGDPASSPHVVSVGGTRLDTSGGDYVSESAWSDGGGGFSTYQPKPSWQSAVVSGNFRSVPDVAFDGDPNSGAQVYVNGSLHQIGGTSLSAPIFAGAWARVLAANPGLTFAAPYLYQTLTAGDYNDVTTGSNATSLSGGLYSAGPGFDQTTGFGSFKLDQVSADLGAPGAPSVSQSFSPSSIAPTATSTLTISLSNVTQPTTDAVLGIDFTDALPTGLMVAATPNASTTCTVVGALSAPANGTAITLPMGSSIPAQTACTITVDISPVGTGTYVNAIAAGSLQTNLGNNANATSATLTVGNGLSYPVASISPGALNFALLTNTSGNKTLTLANTGGGTLTYSFDEATTTATPLDTVSYQWDDGSSEQNDALAGGGNEYEAAWLNRFPVSGPVTINTISIYWPTQTTGTLVGQQPNLIAYYDADGDGDPSNAVRLGGDNLVTISQMGAFQDYNVNLQVPGAGDIYVGFSDAWAANGSALNLEPAAEDTDSPKGHSYIIYNGTGDAPDLNDLSQNTDGGVINANLMIRATGATSYSTTSCDSPQTIDWLSETPATGSIAGGHNQAVTVTADATGMSDGNYSALLCATTNDTEHAKIQVPVTLTVGTTDLPPTASFTVTTDGLTANFTDTSTDSDGTVTGWSWDFGDGSTVSTDQNPSHTYAAPGTYTVTLTATDDGGGTDTATTPVTVAYIAPSVTAAFSPASVPEGVPSMVTITFTNPNATLATLTATFRNNLPTGLTTVAGSAATTCGGSNNINQTATRFTLSNHSTIPASGSCTMTGEVTAAAAGAYTNTIAADDLKTDRGNNAAAASATLTVTPGIPQAVVTPNAFNFSVLVDGTDSGTMNIANQGHADLTWSIAEAAPQIRLAAVKRSGKAMAVPMTHRGVLSMRAAPQASRGPIAAPFVAPKDLSFVLDGGVNDNQLGWGDGSGTQLAALYLNRFAPPAATPAYTIDTISVFWPTQGAGIEEALLGKQARLVAYYDADADGNPANATFLGQSSVTINSLDAFATYHVSFDVPGDGDIYVGFEDTWAEQGYTPALYPVAVDQTFASAESSYLLTMADGSPPYLVNLANNTFDEVIDDLGFPGNFLIRATGNLQGGPTATCTNPSLVPWVSAATTSGTVTPAGNTDVTVSVDATGMSPGSYSALLCVATNDPGNDVVEVPVGMTVTGCDDGVNDRIFADGFDGNTCSVPAANIVTGDFNADVTDDFNGLAVNLVTGTSGPYGNSAGDDLNLYDLGGGGSTIGAYWYADAMPVAVGGAIDGSNNWQILHSGDSVGPGIGFSGNSSVLTNWLGDSDGYIGIAFYNETTGKLNYGYIHLTTTAPLGFPAHFSDYGYNADGGPITIP